MSDWDETERITIRKKNVLFGVNITRQNGTGIFPVDLRINEMKYILLTHKVLLYHQEVHQGKHSHLNKNRKYTFFLELKETFGCT